MPPSRLPGKPLHPRPNVSCMSIAEGSRPFGAVGPAGAPGVARRAKQGTWSFRLGGHGLVAWLTFVLTDLADDTTRIAGCKHAGWDITRDDAARTDHGT